MTKRWKVDVAKYSLEDGLWVKSSEEVRYMSSDRLAEMVSRQEIQLHDAITGGKTTVRKRGLTEVSPCGTKKVIWNW